MYCKCGCEQLVKPGNQFINGHNTLGRSPSEETKNKIRLGNIRKPHKKNEKKYCMVMIMEL
jgi:hypothetical protein